MCIYVCVYMYIYISFICINVHVSCSCVYVCVFTYTQLLNTHTGRRARTTECFLNKTMHTYISILYYRALERERALDAALTEQRTAQAAGLDQLQVLYVHYVYAI